MQWLIYAEINFAREKKAFLLKYYSIVEVLFTISYYLCRQAGEYITIVEPTFSFVLLCLKKLSEPSKMIELVVNWDLWSACMCVWTFSIKMCIEFSFQVIPPKAEMRQKIIMLKKLANRIIKLITRWYKSLKVVAHCQKFRKDSKQYILTRYRTLLRIGTVSSMRLKCIVIESFPNFHFVLFQSKVQQP